MTNALVPPSSTALAPFHKANRLTVRQRKRWLEILTSLDSRNSYAVYDELGNPVFNVEEQGGGIGNFFKRMFLGPMRPFRSHVEDLVGQRQVLELRRPFRFIFHRLEVFDAEGNKIGAIQRRWTWFRRLYIVEGADGQEVAKLFGPLFRPWTFEIRLPGSDVEMGVVQKKWSGLLKEAFTQADNFWVELDRIEDPKLRALLFSATVLIDVVHFERKN
ncbi:hypothetical protein BH11MYX2_BH11MYX2_09830 [soil metagenome]